MKPSNILKSVRKRLELFDNKEAVEVYERQKNAIEGIRNTQGLDEIRLYFLRLYDSSCSELEQVDVNNVWKVASLRSQMSVARSFLSYLDNLAK